MGLHNPFGGGGEGPEMEWKVVLPRDQRVAAILCSFANGCGGVLRVGVADGGAAVGLADPKNVHKELIRIARELLVGEVRWTAREVHPEGKTVVEVHVEAAEDRPVAVWGQDGKNEVYVRDGSSTRRADTAEIRALEHSRRHAHRLQDKHARLMRAVARARPARLAAVARTAHMGKGNARQALVQLEETGLVMIREDGTYWISPEGHRHLR
jgi:hypothetical protein